MMTPAKTRFIVTAAIGATVLLGTGLLLSACGKMGALDQAPPAYGSKAKSDWSVSKNAGGGDTATLENSSASRESERAKPDANAANRMKDPYRSNVPISAAPLEGFGNAEGH